MPRLRSEERRVDLGGRRIIKKKKKIFFKQKTAYEIVIGDWSSDVCSSDLHLLDGKIRRIPAAEELKIPHIGWNDLTFPNEGRLFRGVEEHSYVYFVHSYYLEAADPSIVTATTEYGTLIHASVEKGNIFACQFHPEKSSRVGMKILQNFIEITQEFREKDKQGGR